MNEISVVIPTKNRMEDITRCLESISAQTRLPDELVVVDSSDTEELRSWLDSFCRSRFPVPLNLNLNFKYIHAKVGLTKARNIGLDNSTKDIVIYVDDDVVLDKDCIKEIVHVFDNDLEKRVGIVFCQSIKPITKNDVISDNKILGFFNRIYATLFFLGGAGNEGKFLASGNYTWIRDNSMGDKIVKVDTPTADIYALRREICNEFKWDEELPGGFYGDDIDLSYRVSQKYQNIYNPHAKMTHKPSRGMSNKYVRAKMRMEFQYYFFRKNFPQSFKHKFAFWWSILGILLRSAMGMILQRNSSVFRGHMRGFINIIRGECIQEAKRNMERINQMELWIGEEEKHAIMEYLDSGGWLTEYKKTREFERMIADYVGSKYASVVNNGTVSLVIALLALGIKGGDEVIVPDYTMIASANAVVLAGAKPVLVDIDHTNLCLDPDLVEKAITPKTKAIMLVTINGRYPEMEKFVKFAKDNGLYLIEDAAQSLGSRYNGKHLGTFGDVGGFSFSAPKVITTGQGGALVTDNKELYHRILKIKDFGRAQSGVDYHETMGYNFKFTDLQAVIGIEQMKKLDWRVKRKKGMYKLYRDLLEDIEGIEFIDTNLKDTSPWFIDILVKKGEKERDKLKSFLDEKGIGTRPFYPAIHTQPPYSWAKGDFENSEYVSKRGLWLPSASFLSDEDIERICGVIKKYFRKEKERGIS